jgi:transposase InsO family protein
MWATDGKEFKTDKEGKCWFIGIMDHFNDEIISFVVRKRFDRYAALEPLREAIKSEFKTINKDVCKNLGIALRSDHGSQFESAAYQNELKYLGIDYSPAFVRSPECNGIIERFHRTLNEQIFKLNKFASIEEAQIKIQDFVKKYNKKCILQRLGLQSPKDYRTNYMIQNVKEL